VRGRRVHAPRDRVGAAAVSTVLRAARRVHPPDPVRQARDGHVRPRPGSDDPRGAHGRHPRCHGRGGQRARGGPRGVGGRPPVDALRGCSSGANRRPRSSRRRSARASRRRLALGGRATRRNSSPTSHRSPRTGARGSVSATSCRASATSNGVGPGWDECRFMRLHPPRGKRSLGWPSRSTCVMSPRRSTSQR